MKILIMLSISLVGLFIIWTSVIKKQPPKIAILYIATNRYTVFWNDFYTSMEKNFVPGSLKHYFIFTDDTTLKFPQNVTKIQISSMKFPEVSLMRWSFFKSIENQLSNYDYIYFLNANAQVIQPVYEEIFPTKKQGIMVSWHPGYFYEKDSFAFPYDRNPNSTAYIMMGEGTYYVQGGFNGGRTKDFLKMVDVILKRTQIDQENGQMAVWHDESHLNRYILDKKPLVMDPRYIWTPFDHRYFDSIKDDIKIMIRDKDQFGGVEYLREKALSDESNGIYVIHPYWTDWMFPQKDSLIWCRKTRPSECGKIVWHQNSIEIKWDQYAPELFKQNGNVYQLSDK